MSEFAPMDILGKKFTKKMNGYSPLEVHEYLTDLARVVEGLGVPRLHAAAPPFRRVAPPRP